MIELKIGDTVFVDGHEFVLHLISRVYDFDGSALRVEGLDTLRAYRHIEAQKQSRALIESQLQHIQKCGPLIDELREGDQWKEKKDRAHE